jgi:hypothetical protein
MLQWGSTKRPQCVLQTLRQCHKALTTEHDMRMLPAREGQAEVIEPVIERYTGNADAVIDAPADRGEMMERIVRAIRVEKVGSCQ